jgi:hypothetical protein
MGKKNGGMAADLPVLVRACNIHEIDSRSRISKLLRLGVDLGQSDTGSADRGGHTCRRHSSSRHRVISTDHIHADIEQHTATSNEEYYIFNYVQITKGRPTFSSVVFGARTITCLVHFASHPQCHSLLVNRNYWNSSTCTSGSGRCRQLLRTTHIFYKFRWGRKSHLTSEDGTSTLVRHSAVRVHWDLLYEQCRTYNGASRCRDYKKSMSTKLTDDDRELILHELNAWDVKNSQSKKISKRHNNGRKSIQKSRSSIPTFSSPAFATSPPSTMARPVSDVESVVSRESDCEIIGTSPYLCCKICIEIMITGEIRNIRPSSSQTLPDYDSDSEIEITGVLLFFMFVRLPLKFKTKLDFRSIPSSSQTLLNSSSMELNVSNSDDEEVPKTLSK